MLCNVIEFERIVIVEKLRKEILESKGYVAIMGCGFKLLGYYNFSFQDKCFEIYIERMVVNSYPHQGEI